MTTAVCIYCGELKFGAFVPCNSCDRIPLLKDEVVTSLALSDHYFSIEQLKTFGEDIRNGETVQVDPRLRNDLASQIDQNMLDQLAKRADPEYREQCRKREQRIILGLIAAVSIGTVWMVYRFFSS